MRGREGAAAIRVRIPESLVNVFDPGTKRLLCVLAAYTVKKFSVVLSGWDFKTLLTY